MIQGVNNIGVSTRSIKGLTQFYYDVLGFELVMEMEWEPGTELGGVCDAIIGLRNTTAKAAMVSKQAVRQTC